MNKKTLIVFFALTPLMLLSACSTTSDTELTEIPTSAAPLLDTPEDELFSQAKSQYESELYIVAKESWESLRDGYPLGPYAEFAAIKAADCSFILGNYEEAAIAYENLIKDRPGSQAIPYFFFQAARAHYLTNGGLGRDIAPIEKARKHLKKVLESYPDHTLHHAALELNQQVLETLAANEKNVIHFYERMDKSKAFEARKAEYDKKWDAFIDQFEKTKHIPLGEQASIHELITQEPEENIALTLASGESVVKEQVSIAIQKVTCANDIAEIELSDLPSSFPVKLAKIQPSSKGVLEIQIDGLINNGESFSCFKSSDLQILPTETLALKSYRAASLQATRKPPRIILKFTES